MEKFAKPSPLGYDHSLPMIRMEAKVLGRREQALAGAGSVSNPDNKPKGRPRKVGHHAAVRCPRRFCVELTRMTFICLYPERVQASHEGASLSPTSVPQER
jgi:hypothetical protein